MSPQDLQQIQTIVSGARKILVLTHKNPSIDVLATALSLYLSSVKQGKEVTVAMESEPTVEQASLVGINKIQTTLAPQKAVGGNLVISISNYSAGDVDKVSCAEDLEKGKFNLTLIPKAGATLNPANVTANSGGVAIGDFDLIYTVELTIPDQAGSLYDATIFSKAQIINLDNHDENKDYGKFNLVEPEAASVSEIATFYLRALGVQLDADIAGNLLKGLNGATNNFSGKVTPATHEASAICLRALQPPKPVSPPATPVPPVQPPMANDQSPVTNSTVLDDWTGPKIYRGWGGTTV